MVSPTVTKDGVTVAKEIELEDKFEKHGRADVKEVASKQATSPVTAHHCNSPGTGHLSRRRQGRRGRQQPYGY